MNDLSELYAGEGNFVCDLFFDCFFIVFYRMGGKFKEKKNQGKRNVFYLRYIQRDIAHNPNSKQRLLPS